jgi:hypothetical protein
LSPRDSFLDFITAGRLYAAAIVFASTTVILVLMIYTYLDQKKRRHFVRKRITEKLDHWISEALLDEGQGHTYVTHDLLDEFEIRVNRQFVIDQLISTKKNLTGQAAGNISRLYEQLYLKTDSLKKFYDKRWYRKAKGIYELYMMDQDNMQQEIAAYTNSENEFIRAEAQTALISFSGFDGLAFLDSLTYPLTDWQQLKILEQLKALNPEDMPGLATWIRSGNEYVVLFALRLAEIYYQLQVHDDIVKCLHHSNERIRQQAIISLARLANVSTAAVLTGHYENESPGNKRIILQQLSKIAGDEEIPFLDRELNNPDDLLKLESARVLAKATSQGFDMLAARAAVQPEPYLQIYNHVKYELKK